MCLHLYGPSATNLYMQEHVATRTHVQSSLLSSAASKSTVEAIANGHLISDTTLKYTFIFSCVQWCCWQACVVLAVSCRLLRASQTLRWSKLRTKRRQWHTKRAIEKSSIRELNLSLFLRFSMYILTSFDMWNLNDIDFVIWVKWFSMKWWYECDV